MCKIYKCAEINICVKNIYICAKLTHVPKFTNESNLQMDQNLHLCYKIYKWVKFTNVSNLQMCQNFQISQIYKWIKIYICVTKIYICVLKM